MECERSGDVRGEVAGVVAAGIDVKFVRDLAPRENFVECGGTGLEAIIVLIAAIEIYLQAREVRGTRQRERAVGIPKSSVWWVPKHRAENP